MARGEWTVPLPVNWTGQLVHGLRLPFQLIRTVLEDRELRGRYLTVSVLQALATLGLAVLFTGSGREAVGTVHRLVYWAALLSSLQLAQWLVVALSRDFHTALSREVSLRTGVAPEDEPLTPRIRLNLPWLRTKMKRRWRALVVFGLGVPVLWLLTLFLPWSDRLLTVLTSLWGAWWFVVFTAGKSALAWSEQAPREPWFLRGWNGLTSRAAPLRWALLGVYGSLWRKHTREVFSPAASVERRPWALVGLATVRAFAALPLVKCFLRPIIPVAAAHLLAHGEPAPGPELQ